jgi:hypothetical protein
MKYFPIFLCFSGGLELVGSSTPPACSSLQEAELKSGTLCQKTETKKKRDKVLEKLVAQAWRAIDVGSRLMSSNI